MSHSRTQEEFESEHIFHEREWRIQRIGWVLITLFLALALGGLFGGGPLSYTRADSAAGRIDYERFVRYGSETALNVTPSGSEHGVTRIEIDAGYLEAFRVERVTPQPAAVRIAGEKLVYEFASTSHGASICFHLRPRRLWRQSASLGIDGGAPVQISQLTYP